MHREKIPQLSSARRKGEHKPNFDNALNFSVSDKLRSFIYAPYHRGYGAAGGTRTPTVSR